ncbi:hypothetical protein LTR67_010551 [Exophiala xenobiotica]
MFAHEDILSAFDDLVARNIVLYGPETVVNLVDDDFQLSESTVIETEKFEFHICPALASKPSTVNAATEDGLGQLPKYGPGSDLVDADPLLKVAEVSSTHLLVLNRFCVFRPQFLILTRDSFKRQTEILDVHDLSAAWTVLQNLEQDCFVMFNCGNEAGCSRLHKHMQVIPCSGGFTLFPDRDNNKVKVPFTHFLRRIQNGGKLSTVQGAISLVEVYQELLEAAFSGKKHSNNHAVQYHPHNVVLTKRWLMVIPRTKAAVHGASANAAGMMGMVWVTSEHELQCWKEQGLSNVLGELGTRSRSSDRL